jgi:hypothetical protein
MNVQPMRWLFTILAAISLALFTLTVFFYVRSYWRFDGVLHFVEHESHPAPGEFRPKGKSTGFISYKGQLTYVSIINPIGGDAWEGWSVPADATFASGPMNLVWDVRERTGLEFGSARTRSALTDPMYQVTWQLAYTYGTFPYWVLAILFAILPARWMLSYRRAARREREGRCLRCGYDLRGSTSGKCPECGTPVPVES